MINDKLDGYIKESTEKLSEKQQEHEDSKHFKSEAAVSNLPYIIEYEKIIYNAEKCVFFYLWYF